MLLISTSGSLATSLNPAHDKRQSHNCQKNAYTCISYTHLQNGNIYNIFFDEDKENHNSTLAAMLSPQKLQICFRVYKQNLKGTTLMGKEYELEPRVSALIGEITAANQSKKLRKQ